MRRALATALLVMPLFVVQPIAAQDPQSSPATTQAAARTALSQQLVDLGLTQKEADSRVSKLADAEVVRLVENPKQVGLGGIKDKTLIIIAVILILPSILLLAAL